MEYENKKNVFIFDLMIFQNELEKNEAVKSY